MKDRIHESTPRPLIPAAKLSFRHPHRCGASRLSEPQASSKTVLAASIRMYSPHVSSPCIVSMPPVQRHNPSTAFHARTGYRLFMMCRRQSTRSETGTGGSRSRVGGRSEDMEAREVPVAKSCQQSQRKTELSSGGETSLPVSVCFVALPWSDLTSI